MFTFWINTKVYTHVMNEVKDSCFDSNLINHKNLRIDDKGNEATKPFTDRTTEIEPLDRRSITGHTMGEMSMTERATRQGPNNC
ncbi:hypothetical protein BLOT_014611 [Blomia tropicalis]|nr:hypothetical protein BLOT_014611 [Blomia tropicalis]